MRKILHKKMELRVRYGSLGSTAPQPILKADSAAVEEFDVTSWLCSRGKKEEMI
jgi:hypothetical protein